MNGLGWLLFGLCCAMCFVLGYMTRSWRREAALYRAEDERDRLWNELHGGVDPR